MIIFQTACGSATSNLRLGRSLLVSTGTPQSTTFRSNAYIHRLNRTLQAEMRALSACHSAAGRIRAPRETDLLGFVSHHQAAGRELVRLIIAHRGLPEERAPLSLDMLTRTLLRLCSKAPSRLAGRVTLGTLSQVEAHLGRCYLRLLDLAPEQDAPLIASLHERAQRHLAQLEGEPLP